jgi:hypothetical protein
MKYKLTTDEFFVFADSVRFCSIKAAEKAFYKFHKVTTVEQWNAWAKKYNWHPIRIIEDKNA